MSTPTKWGTEFRVNTTTPGDQRNGDITALADGRFVVTWSDDGNGNGVDIRAQIFHADGTKDGVEFVVNTVAAGGQDYSKVAARSDGGFVVVWLDDNQAVATVKAQIFKADGAKQGSEITVGSAFDMALPDVQVLSNGKFIVTWNLDGNAGAYGQIFDANGAPVGNDFQIVDPVAGAQGGSRAPVITALDNGNFAVAWSETDGTHYTTHTQIYTSNGLKVGTEIQVTNQNNGYEYPSVTSAGSGYIIAWQDWQTGDLRAQRFKWDGTEIGSPITLKHESGANNASVAITAMQDGHFFAAWQHQANGGVSDIRGQFFDAGGNPIGDELVIDSTPAGYVFHPALTMLEDGRIVVSWTYDDQFNGPDPGYGVRSQIIDPRQGPTHLKGTALNDEYVGTTFSETIGGDAGDDRLEGGGGNDIFVGGAGADTLIGGAGLNDTARYSGSPSGVKVSLATGKGTGGDAAGDVLLGIEHLAGSYYDDTLTGNGGDNRLEGGHGADILDGGNGNDTAVYRFSDSITVNLTTGTGSGGDAAGDKLSNIENVDGGDHNDTLVGNVASNILGGGFGNDTLKGGGGADTLYGGGDTDTALYNGASTDYTIIRLANGDVQISDLRAGSPDGVDTLNNIEKLVFSDGTFDMTVFADQAPYIVTDGGGDNAGVSTPENATAVTIVQAFDLDPGATFTYAIVGGADAGRFQIDAASGALSFVAAPDFEQPADADHNNSYIVQVRASDGILFDDQVITVNVTDVADVSAAAAARNDFNGDGHSDILWQNADGTPMIWSMDGLNATSMANAGFNPGAAWHVIDSGDFNGDGKSDILWQNADGTPAVWLMDGPNILSGANVGFNPGADWHEIAAADFNGDGKADILWQNADGQVAVWQMDGLNVVSGTNAGPNVGAAWHAIGAGDFDGDGRADILLQNQNGQAAVWLMDGFTVKSGSDVGFNPGAAWHVQGAGDFNGDGKDDILWQNADGTPAVWLMDGTSLISGSNVGFNPGAAWQVHGTGDFNGDGKADIQWQNTDGTPAVWLMDGYDVVSGANAGADPGASWHVIPQHHDLV